MRGLVKLLIAFIPMLVFLPLVTSIDCITDQFGKMCDIQFDPTYKSPYGSVTRTISNLNPSAGEEIVITYIATIIDNNGIADGYGGISEDFNAGIFKIGECDMVAGNTGFSKFFSDLNEGTYTYSCTLTTPSETTKIQFTKGIYSIGEGQSYDIGLPLKEEVINISKGPIFPAYLWIIGIVIIVIVLFKKRKR